MTCRSPSSEAASAAWPRPCRCYARESTCRCSSRRRPWWRSARASRSARTHRGCCTAGACAARWTAPACARWPCITGCIAYRGLVPADRLGHLELEVLANNWMGPGGHFVHYFVAGGRLVNFVAINERETWTRESWTDRGEVADALAAFKGWHPQVGAIIGAVDETFIWALFDRAPLDHWSVGRVTLLGDACHAMLPFMAQGAR